MTSEQLAALEAVAGRALTAEEQTAIDAYLPSRNDVAIAAILSVGRTKLVPTEIGNGLILATVGLTVGDALLDVLNAAPDFRYVKPLLEQGRLDISSTLARAALDSLVGVVDGFTAGHAASLKELAERPDPIHQITVSEALNGVENG